VSADPNHQVALLEFRLDQGRFAIACELVAEVLPMLPIRELPGAPPAIVGVISIRGVLLPLLDPRPRLGHAPWRACVDAHIVSAFAGGRSVGLVVDSADDVFTVAWGAICRPGVLEPQLQVPYALGLVGRDNGQVVVLDLDALVTHDEWKGVVRAVDRAS